VEGFWWIRLNGELCLFGYFSKNSFIFFYTKMVLTPAFSLIFRIRDDVFATAPRIL